MYNKKEYESLRYATRSKDPIQLAIFAEIERLRLQNKRLLEHMERSGYWADLKDVEKWKPFDFFHYFCNLYQQKYKRQYKLSGNIVKAYQQIEIFLDVNDIDNVDFKKFMDLAFNRHFNNNQRPVMGSICSATLYNKITQRMVRVAKNVDHFDAELRIKKESEEFEREVCGQEVDELDAALEQENARMKKLDDDD